MLDRDSMAQIAAGQTPSLEGLMLELGALPPPPVAQRILAALENGTLPEWCMSYLVVEKATRRVVACCNFKGTPTNRSVEIGYGVAPSCWGKGIATAAASFLIEVAKKSALVDVLVANISPDNHASQKVVSKLGFVNSGRVFGSGREALGEWTLGIAA